MEKDTKIVIAVIVVVLALIFIFNVGITGQPWYPSRSRCMPKTCWMLGKSCGSWSNGCGGSVFCGSCSSGYICSSGKCVPSCSNECSSGARQCTGTNTYKTCGNYDSDPCTEWSSSISCGSSYTCSGGNCILSCTNECSTGTRQCSGSLAYQLCGNYDSDSCFEWGSVMNCPLNTTSCSGGYCLS